MASVIPENSYIEITCPKCNKKIKRTIRWFKTATACPFCGCGIDTREFRRGVDEANKAIADAFKKMSDSFKRTEIKIKI